MVSTAGENAAGTFVIDVDAPANRVVFGEGNLVLARAPDGDAFVALPVREGRPRSQDGYRVLNQTGQPLGAYPSDCVPLLLDAERLVLCEQTPEADPPQVAVVLVNTRSGARTTLGEEEGRVWDDVPLSLTPEGDSVCFHLRRSDTRGLYCVALAGGPVAEFVRDGFFAVFHDAQTAFVLTNTDHQRLLQRFDYAASGVSNPRPIPVVGALLAMPVDAGRALVFAREEEHSWPLHLLSLESGETQVLDPSASVTDGTPFGPFVRIAGDRIVYVGRGDEGSELRVVSLDGAEPPRRTGDQTFRQGFVVGLAP